MHGLLSPPCGIKPMSEKQMSFIVENSSTRRKAFWKSLTFLISDSGTLVFGSGAKKTAHELQKQREKWCSWLCGKIEEGERSEERGSGRKEGRKERRKERRKQGNKTQDCQVIVSVIVHCFFSACLQLIVCCYIFFSLKILFMRNYLSLFSMKYFFDVDTLEKFTVQYMDI